MRVAWNTLSFFCLLWLAPAPAPSMQPQPSATIGPHGGAYVTSLPGDASAWLDGAYAGDTPVFVDDLLPGTHSLTVTRAGWQPQTMTFDVSAGSIVPVSIVMRKSLPPSATPANVPKGQGSLEVLGAAPGAKIYVDGAVIGASPADPRPVEAGFHIVTLELADRHAPREMRIVDVYPDTTTVLQFGGETSVAQPDGDDDLLEPLDSVVPSSDVVMAGADITIHHQGVEVECAIGSRSYTLDGRAGTLAVAPAVVGGKIYLPKSLLDRLGGK